jgi:hypothetical protein
MSRSGADSDLLWKGLEKRGTSPKEGSLQVVMKISYPAITGRLKSSPAVTRNFGQPSDHFKM